MSVNIYDPELFSEALFEKMKHISPVIEDLELYEFRYALNNLIPENGWGSVKQEKREDVEQRINSRAFYKGIQIKPRVNDRIALDDQIVHLTNMLFVGLVNGTYEENWVNTHFYFDVRGFLFMHRTLYFTDAVKDHFGGKLFMQFEQKQTFERFQSVGYKAFKEANAT
jgi:hypothetical protein